MNSEKRARAVLILQGILVCSICVPGVQGQEAKSSAHFGQRPPSAGSTVGATAPIGGQGSGGGSSWRAGSGSFGTGVQQGGIWHDDGPSLGPAATGAGSSTQVRPSATSAHASGAGVPSGFSSSTPSSFHANAGTGATRSFHSTAGHFSGASVIGHGVMAGSKGRSHAAAGSQWRVASSGHGSARAGTRRPSGVTTSMPKQSVTGNSHLDLGLDMGLPTKGVGHQSP
jgi:hypothetical protein